MPKPLTDAKVAEILDLYRSGHSIKATAKMAGVCPYSVSINLQRNGLVGLRPRRWSDEKKKEILTAYLGGMPGVECCRKFGCDFSALKKYVRQGGHKFRTHAESMSGAGNPAWKGGRILRRGYICLWIPDHPYATKNGYVPEHRLIMEKHIGRYLVPQEVVHHKDKDKSNNAIENLELFESNGAHLAHELKGCVPKWTEDGKRRIRAGHLGPQKGSRNSAHSKIDVNPLS